MFHKEEISQTVVDSRIGRRLLNVREAAQYWGSKWTPSTGKPGCGRFPASRLVERCGSMLKQ